MNKAKKDEMRAEYRREDLGKGVRGKYFERVSKGTNLVHDVALPIATYFSSLNSADAKVTAACTCSRVRCG